MSDQADSRHYLQKHHQYRMKARAASEPNTRAAFEAVAREFLRRAASAANAGAHDVAHRYASVRK